MHSARSHDSPIAPSISPPSAVSYGKLSASSAARAPEITYSRLVKDYAERALALDPGLRLGQPRPPAAGITKSPASARPKRFFAKLIYGGLPPASTAEAVRLLRRAVKLAPQIAAHHVELGFAYLADKQPGLARAELEQARGMPSRVKYDVEEKARAQAALEKLR